MTTPPDTPAICSLLIGRTRELTALHSLLVSVKSGQGQVALISGEASIGKSRLPGCRDKNLYPRPGGQQWATFLRNHAGEIWACDFLQITDLFFRSFFAFFIIDLKSLTALE